MAGQAVTDDRYLGMPWMGTHDRQGNAISYDEYVRLRYQDESYWRVAETYVGPYRVSTVWLGVDHHFGRGTLAIFETMVFAEESIADERGTHWDHYQDRYATEAEALAGHAKVVELLREHYDARAGTTSPEQLRPGRGDREDEELSAAAGEAQLGDHEVGVLDLKLGLDTEPGRMNGC